MFKLTEKAKAFNKFFIQHIVECDDYDVTEGYASLEEAIKYEVQSSDCSEEEMAKAIREYTQEEIIEAAEEGYGWPMMFGYVEEVDEDENKEESETMSSINTTAPAKFFNFDKNKLQFWFSDDPEFNEISTNVFVSIFTGSFDRYCHSWSVEADAVFSLPGDPEQYSRPAHEDVISSLLKEEVGKIYEVEIKSVEVYIPEILGDSLETAVKIVNGTIEPRIVVQLSWGDYFEYSLSVPDGVEYHPEIEKEVEKLLEKNRRLEEVEVELTSRDIATYILSEGGAHWGGNGIGWIIKDVKNPKAQSIVSLWNNEEKPAEEWEVEVFGHLKDYLS